MPDVVVALLQTPEATAAEQTAIQVFEMNFIRLAGTAARVARSRAEDFTHTFLSQLEQSTPDALDRATDPAFLNSLYTGQREYALSGRKDLQETLIGLLLALAQAPPQSLVQISVSEAIERASKLTAAQVNILAMIFVITRVRWELLYRNSDFPRFAAEMLQPHLGSELGAFDQYSHLMALGCINMGPAPQDIEVFFMQHFRTLFAKGIPRGEVAALAAREPAVWQLFEPSGPGDDDRLRLMAQTNESIREHAQLLGLSNELISELFQLDARHLMTGAEKIAHVKSLHHCIESFWGVWTAPHAPLPRSQLTTTGVALAHTQLVAKGKPLGPLSLWLSG